MRGPWPARGGIGSQTQVSSLWPIPLCMAKAPVPAPLLWLQGPAQHRHVTALLTSLPWFPTAISIEPASRPFMGGQQPPPPGCLPALCAHPPEDSGWMPMLLVPAPVPPLSH